MLSVARSLEAMAQFGRDRGRTFTRLLGFTRDRPPCKATFHNVFKALDTTLFERAIRRWLRGRTASGWAATVIGQLSVEASTNKHHAALALLDLIDVDDATVTGNTMFCQRDLSQKVLKKRGLPLDGQGQSTPTQRSDRRGTHQRARVSGFTA